MLSKFMRTIHKKGKVRRKAKLSAKIKGTLKRPRLSVFRSNRFIYAQIINDDKGMTLVNAHKKEIKSEKGKKLTKIKTAYLLGQILGEKAREKGISTIVFDRNGYKYHGRVRALAEGAREAGLKF